MKKLIIKESVIDGKMSKAELLIKVLLGQTQYSIGQIGFEWKRYLKSASNEEIENLADDMTYWEDTGNYEVSLDKAKKRISNIVNRIEKSYNNFRTLNRSTDNFLKLIDKNENISFNNRIKLFLYFTVYYKNKELINKKLKQLTGWDYNKIINVIQQKVNEDTSNNAAVIEKNIYWDDNIGVFVSFIYYYNDNKPDLREIIEKLLIEKTHRKNKVKL